MQAKPFDHNGTTYHQYNIPFDYLTDEVLKCRSRIEQFCRQTWPNTQSIVSVDSLYQVFMRVDQRKLHYLMYHDTEINEVKETATICYWIIKYKPFIVLETHPNGEIGLVEDCVCEKFCMRLLEAVVAQFRLDTDKPPMDFSFKRDGKHETSLQDDILYYFQNRITTPDSILAIAEALAKA